MEDDKEEDIMLGKMFRQARMDNGLTQEKLAELVEITPIHLKLIESGKRTPSLGVFFNLVKVLNVSVDSIIIGRDFLNGKDESLYVELLYLLQKCTPAELKLITDIIKAIQENREK